MSGFVITHKALHDLKLIGQYTEHKWGRKQRNRYLSMLDRCFHDLAASPFMGHDCGIIRSGYRTHQAKRHLIFYRVVASDQIEIVRVLHDRMDAERHFDG